MDDLIIDDIDDDVMVELQRLADSNGRSVEDEALDTRRTAVRERRTELGGPADP